MFVCLYVQCTNFRRMKLKEKTSGVAFVRMIRYINGKLP